MRVNFVDQAEQCPGIAYASVMLMHGFPPTGDARVTLANWQDPPFNRWSFSHMRELLPTQRISRGSALVAPLAGDPKPLGQIRLRRTDGSEADVDAVLDDTYTDAVVIVHGGRVVFERYVGETGRDTPHLLMSISKSVVSCVVGILVERGLLSPAHLVIDHVPELNISGYRTATIRNLLDMRSGVKFSEDYLDLNAEVRDMEEAMGWRPSSVTSFPQSMYAYLQALEQEREHGGAFDYRSCETDVLGWICEKATGTRMADLISELVWAPINADWDAEITCDPVGTAIHDGGMNATARDLARFGMMLLADGTVEGRRVVSEEWLHTSWDVDADVREAFTRSASGPFMPGGWYRNKFWFLPRPRGVVLLCLGINGQMLYVSPATGMVAAKMSSWPHAQSVAMLHDTLLSFDAVGAALGAPDGPWQPGVPGVAAGMSRSRLHGPNGGARPPM